MDRLSRDKPEGSEEVDLKATRENGREHKRRRRASGWRVEQ